MDRQPDISLLSALMDGNRHIQIYSLVDGNMIPVVPLQDDPLHRLVLA